MRAFPLRFREREADATDEGWEVCDGQGSESEKVEEVAVVEVAVVGVAVVAEFGSGRLSVREPSAIKTERSLRETGEPDRGVVCGETGCREI
jgi:hypothetical protein